MHFGFRKFMSNCWKIHIHVSLLCEFWTGSIIESFFFGNAADRIIIVNGARYRDMIIQFFMPKLYNIYNYTNLYLYKYYIIKDMNMDDIWFQQEICHTARKIIQLLHESFPGRNFPFSSIRIGRIVQFGLFFRVFEV